MLAEIRAPLTALASSLRGEAPPVPGGPLGAARALFALLERQETRHVRQALRDEEFPFGEAQRQLGEVRRAFAACCRDLVRSPSAQLTPRERREVLDMAYLIKCAPLTDSEDLAALRKARASSRLVAAAS